MSRTILSDEHGEVRLATIATYGDTIHTFVERTELHGPFLPGFRAVDRAGSRWRGPSGLQYIDHMVGNVGWDEMNRWVDFYQRRDGLPSSTSTSTTRTSARNTPR